MTSSPSAWPLLILTCRKQWEIYHADPITAAYMEAIPIMNIWTSWDAPQLVIPQHTLDYGFYLATYTVTMWGGWLDQVSSHRQLQKSLFLLIQTLKTYIIFSPFFIPQTQATTDTPHTTWTSKNISHLHLYFNSQTPTTTGTQMHPFLPFKHFKRTHHCSPFLNPQTSATIDDPHST